VIFRKEEIAKKWRHLGLHFHPKKLCILALVCLATAWAIFEKIGHIFCNLMVTLAAIDVKITNVAFSKRAGWLT
jgi:hypothetical protein